MELKNNLNKWLILCTCIATLTFNARAAEGSFTNTVLTTGKNSLTEKYDVFTEDNKKFTLKLGSIKSYKNITLVKSEKSNSINVYSSSMMKGDGRYSRPRSGKIEIKFDNDQKTYDLGGTSYYLRYTTTDIDKVRNSEFLNKLAAKNFMHVKVIVVGQEFVFKVSLKGTKAMLKTGSFI